MFTFFVVVVVCPFLTFVLFMMMMVVVHVRLYIDGCIVTYFSVNHTLILNVTLQAFDMQDNKMTRFSFWFFFFFCTKKTELHKFQSSEKKTERTKRAKESIMKTMIIMGATRDADQRTTYEPIQFLTFIYTLYTSEPMRCAATVETK